MKKRIAADVLLFLSVFLAPWQVTAAGALFFLFFFRNFWEAAIIGFIFDVLYSVPGAGIYGRFGFFTVFAITLIFLTKTTREKIRWFA
jgi:hypothetical protein